VVRPRAKRDKLWKAVLQTRPELDR
jgi:hypothetical protein